MFILIVWNTFLSILLIDSYQKQKQINNASVKAFKAIGETLTEAAKAKKAQDELNNKILDTLKKIIR